MRTLVYLLLPLFFFGCATHSPKTITNRHSAAPSGWYGENEDILKTMIDEFGNQGPHYLPTKKPVAVFDWDNTVMKNDAGYSTFFWMITHNLIKPPKNWKTTSPFLNDKAVKALHSKCKEQLPGGRLRTHRVPECADLLLAIFLGEDLPASSGGGSAWKDTVNPDLLNAPYGWFAAILAGNTVEEVKQFTANALSESLSNFPEAKQMIGSKPYPVWVRFYPQMKELIHVMQQNGFEVWTTSATPQSILEVYADVVGIAPDHVIGLRSVLKNKRLSTSLETCGNQPANSNSVIPYRLGKRCFINKMIFGVKDKDQMMNQKSDLLFAAGDSDADVFFMKDAAYHLVLNRNSPELMCNAYANQDQHWIINPMFILPRAQKKSDSPGVPAYSCQAYGLPDQKIDTVFVATP